MNLSNINTLYTDFNIISCIIINHYDFTINSSIQSLAKYFRSKYQSNAVHFNEDYYLLISFEIAQMLIESHHSIRKQFKGAMKKNGLKSNDFSDQYYSKKLNNYLFQRQAFKKIEISRMDLWENTCIEQKSANLSSKMYR